MEGKIIAVWGSPHSGKTTFATKLATAIYSSFESTVITLYTDLETPVIPVLFPFDKNEDLGSVGYPLSKTEVEQGDIINNLVTVCSKISATFSVTNSMTKTEEPSTLLPSTSESVVKMKPREMRNSYTIKERRCHAVY